VYRDVAVHVSPLCEALGAARVLACDGLGMRLLVTSGYLYASVDKVQFKICHSGD
jgi:hypothetical protein